MGNRDFEMATRTQTQNYRGRKDSALALYDLWRTGEVLTHHRANFERVYALTETIAPAHLLRESDEGEADRFLIQKEISFSGRSRLNRTSDSYHRGVPFSKVKQIRAAMLADGASIEEQVEGWQAVHYALSSDAEVLHDLNAGRVPEAWTPLGTTTTEAAVGERKYYLLFSFDYVWEVYKPAHQRRFGYYTLPVLWGDRLVARFDSKLDRATGTFVILGVWLEDQGLGKDEAFAEAWAGGLARFVTFLARASWIHRRLANRCCADAPALRKEADASRARTRRTAYGRLISKPLDRSVNAGRSHIKRYSFIVRTHQHKGVFANSKPDRYNASP